MNRHVWLFFNQGGFGTEIETLSSTFLVIEKVHSPPDLNFRRWPDFNFAILAPS